MQGGRIGDPSKMAAVQYVSSNRQRQSMGRLPIYVYVVNYSTNIHICLVCVLLGNPFAAITTVSEELHCLVGE